MASSNRHWPSMFKSKPCNPLHQWQYDLNPSLLSGYHRNPYTSGVDERSPDPKPRWNPKPEQIRILEAIFNSGMVNPPRDEIRKIRAQLQEFGQVGDANVFYWFQNRKSRTKHKNRQLSKSQHNKSSTQPAISTTITNNATPMINNPSSSSSSSDKASPKPNFFKTTTCPNDLLLGSCSSNFNYPLTYCPTASVNQTTYDHVVQQETFMLPIQPLNYPTQCITGLTDHQSHFQTQQVMTLPNNANNNVINIPQSVGTCGEFLFSELMKNDNEESFHKENAGDEETLMMMKLGYPNSTTTSSRVANNIPISSSTAMYLLPSTLDQLQGADDSCVSATFEPMKSTVFINDVAFEVSRGPFNVHDAFGNDAVLLHSTGQPVLTNDWGVTLQPLQHGAFYYLI